MEQFSHPNLNQVTDQLWLQLKPHILYLPSRDVEIVELAFWQMVEAHGPQRRKSGDFYITHPVSACIYLATIGLDRDTLAACLLHDVPEDTTVSLQILSNTFNSSIIFLISGITKLSKIKYQGEARYAENLRKMFVAMSQDLRVIFIKLADRLHNLTTLEYLPPQKARRIALESLEIYVPIAQKLGISYFQGKIEDAAFKYAYPEEYETFTSLSDIEIKGRQRILKSLQKQTVDLLKQDQVTSYRLKGRAKKYYSIYRKTKDKQKSLREIRDLVALRIITPTIEDCYQVFSILSKNFSVVPGTTKDYITLPKSNGYQSLHVTVDNKRGGMVEFQVRTEAMDRYAEYGAASHWVYKDRSNSAGYLPNPENFKWISELVDLSNQTLTSTEYIKYVKLDLYQDRIFVLTPNNDVLDLPVDSSPLDFAYHIHSDIGNKAILARVNGQPMKLSGTLSNGDQVEIVTDKHQQPKLDWLSYVKSRSAAHQIRYQLRQQGVLKPKK